MIKIKEIRKTCIGCPAQWEGITTENKSVYVRYRWGNLSIDIGGKDFIHKSIGNGLDGCMDYTELKWNTKELIEWPEHEN